MRDSGSSAEGTRGDFLRDGASHSSARATILVALGNALSFYELIIFGLFAVQIGRAIFPASDPATELLLALGTFGAGFVTRPLGAFFLGGAGDRLGRGRAFRTSLFLAGIAAVGQCAVPPFASAGLGAPLAMLLLRLILGFAIGGIVGPATALLAETGESRNSALRISLQFASQHLALVAAATAGWLLTTTLGAGDLASWGWRAAMVPGLAIPAVALLLPVKALDAATRADPTPPRARQAGEVRIAMLSTVILGGATVATYGLSYLPVYVQATLGLPPQNVFAALALYGLVAIPADLVGGKLADRIGARPVMLGGFGILAISIIPAFRLLAGGPGLPILCALSLWLSLHKSIGQSAALAAISRALPARRRSQTLSLSYALAAALFGATAQPIAAWLTAALEDPVAPAYYLFVVLLAGLAAMAVFPEVPGSRRPGAMSRR